ncbi:MAG: hypothetical protein NTW59_04465 [Candidatus Diapherotrites archaeon]|nr:hypothetical protein [Candidatus Diapherotrites archaeon]
MMFVFDSSALISMSQTCLVKILRQLREALGAEFVIAESVYRETVSTPLHIRRFELNAVRLKKAVDEKWLRIEQVDTDAAMDIVKTANNCFFAKGGPVSLMHRGEADALALVRQLNAQVLVIDERTTRMLLETPLRLKELLEGKHNAKIGARKDNLERLQGMRFTPQSTAAAL